jgi:hypothetical protein
MLLTTVADEITPVATAVTLSFTATDAAEAAIDPGTLAVVVTSSDGTTVASGNASGTGTDARTFALTAANTATVERLTVTWTDSSDIVLFTQTVAVRRPLLTFADYKLREPGKIADSAKFVRSRREVTDLVEDRCNRAFTPRLDVERVTSRGGNSISLRFPDLIDVVWATDEDGNTIDISTVPANGAGIAALPSSCWPCGDITIAYRHGFTRPPDDVIGAVAKAITANKVEGTGITSTRVGDVAVGGFVPRAGYGRAITAIDEVDEVLNAHKWHRFGVA